MSDNPADSLRRELGETLSAHQSRGNCACDRCSLGVLWPLIAAALEAARADERERLQQENQELRKRLEAIRRDPTLALVTNVKPFKVVFEDGD